MAIDALEDDGDARAVRVKQEDSDMKIELESNVRPRAMAVCYMLILASC